MRCYFMKKYLKIYEFYRNKLYIFNKRKIAKNYLLKIMLKFFFKQTFSAIGYVNSKLNSQSHKHVCGYYIEVIEPKNKTKQ